MELLLIAVTAVVAIVVVNSLASRTGVAAPLLLVAVGIAVSFLPFVPAVEVGPEVILAGVLPPLLYSAAVSLPTMDFRRDFTAISGLSVVLVVLTSLLLGLLFWALIPGLGLAGGIAVGAIVSPTDAVATAIAKRLGAPSRVITVLEGEGLLNDASALVLLRSAVAATAAAVSVWHVIGDFLWAVAAAAACGALVGWLGLLARRRAGGATLSTALSFVIPFLAYLPAEHLHASGLVAVVTAGLVTGAGSARYLGPQDRLSERSNWHTVETLLEGGVFLLMGLELFGLVEDVKAERDSVWTAVALGALAAVAVLAVRAAYLAPLLVSLARRARRAAARRDAVQSWHESVGRQAAQAGDDGKVVITGPRGTRAFPVAQAERLGQAIVRRIADIDYLTSRPLRQPEGVLLVWAGMRGVVTLAAAQSLPVDFPHRSFVVLVAFTVAAGTLLVQGGTLPWLLRRLNLSDPSPQEGADLAALRRTGQDAARDVLDDTGLARADGGAYDPQVLARVRADVVRDEAGHDIDVLAKARLVRQYRELRLRVIDNQRSALLAARSTGRYDARELELALDTLDAEQIMVEMRTASPGDEH
ncbi:cation:proton antiporter [Catellatospora bangladeshensis]|uniref:Peptidase n=1 Tax=Catellatospora bangladeshensis TaxID=310355 RepID=A0A8J3JQS2_9ACTN|nr:cation:proton antiporter [Catellatospora bangladeshensis]GIF81519.1 peptidase [Catellatospora bangladeshensis]